MGVEVHDKRLPGGMLEVDTDDPKLAAQAAQKYLAKNPPPETSQSLGFEQGVGNFLANATRPAAFVADKLGIPTDWLKQSQDILRNPQLDWHKDAGGNLVSAPKPGPQQVPGGIGKFVGTLPGAIGLSMTGMGPLAAGGLTGMLASEKTDPTGRLVQPSATDTGVQGLLGAVTGKGTDLALQGAGQVISPVLSPAVQRLMQARIPLTPGQTLGGIVQSLENKATSLPLVGDLISSAQRNSVVGFNRAVANDALHEIGQTAPANVAAGRALNNHVGQAISDHYDSILPHMTGVLDPTLQADINTIAQNAIGQGAKQETLDRFNNIIRAQLNARGQPGMVPSYLIHPVAPGQTLPSTMVPAQVLTGDALKIAQQNLGRIGRQHASATDGDAQQLGDLVIQAQAAFNRMLERTNPSQAASLRAANAAFARYARMRQAGSALGNKDGVFTPAQFSNAVKAGDASAGKGAYAGGNALMQDLSDSASQVLPSTVPDSGTTGRAILAALVSGGAHFNPYGAAGLAATGALYTQPGQAAARMLLSGARPAWAPAVRAGINRARVPASVLSAVLAAQTDPKLRQQQ